MSRRTPRRGRPTRYTPDLAQAILTAVERGNHISTACALHHLPPSTLYRWLEYADAKDHADLTGQPYPHPQHHVYQDFRDRLAAARAKAEARAVEVVDRAMQGGYVISEEPAVDGNGQVIRDDNGEILFKRTWAEPDGRLALSYLAKSRPDVWGQSPTQRLEVSSTVAAAVEQETQVEQVQSLAQRLALTVGESVGDGEWFGGEGEIVEGEIVDGPRAGDSAV